jgi:hypothetical protein
MAAVRRGRESKARRRLLRLAVVLRAFFSAALAASLAIAGVAARGDQPIDAVSGAGATETPKVLRYAFRVAETGFDPAQITDLYSRTSPPTSSKRRTSTSSSPGRCACGR